MTARNSLRFSGRSRRTEYVCYLLVSMFLGALVNLAAGSLLEWSEANVVYVATEAILGVPLFALIARRFHDIGLTGWLALPLLPAALKRVYQDYWYRFTPPAIMISHGYPLGGWLTLIGLPGAVVALWALLQDGQHQANRFGIDPRSVDFDDDHPMPRAA